MNKEKAAPVDVVFLVGRKVGDQYEVAKVRRKGEERSEEVVRRTGDKRIAGDALSQAFMEMFR
jgi:hypothetical protein